jgi:hypothetical protein
VPPREATKVLWWTRHRWRDNGATGDLGGDGHHKSGEAMDGVGGAVDGVKQPASRSIPAVDAGLPRSAEHRQAGLR